MDSASRPKTYIALRVQFCLVAVLVLVAVPAFAKPTEVVAKAFPAVVVVESEGANGGVIQGSGVVYHRSFDDSILVATNCHVVKSGTRLSLKVGVTVKPASLVAIDEELDLCLLNSSGLPVREAQVRNGPALSIGETVYAVGAPHGLELSLSNGIISQLREHPSTYRLVQTTAPISKGSSGGGLFDADGRLIGITTFYISDSQNLNFAIPATVIEDLWHASLIATAIWHVARTPEISLAATLEQAVPGWRSDLDRPSFRRWLGLARDSKGRRRDGGVSFLSALDPHPADWRAVVELFRNYRASPFYGVDQPTRRSPRPESRPPVWELIAQGNDFTMYADRTRIRRQGARLIAWTLRTYP